MHEAKRTDRTLTIEGRTAEQLRETETAIIAAIDADNAARPAGASDQALAEARDVQRKANSPDPGTRALLAGIRTVHSAIFLVMLAAIGWLVTTGITGRRDRTVAVAAALVAGESAVFVANRGVCPLTPLAERYSEEPGGVSDIFLPDVVARTIPIWATSMVVLGFGLHLRQLARGRVRRGRPR